MTYVYDELTKEEWREVCRLLAPEWDDERFEEEWEEFCRWRERRGLH